MTKNLCIYHDNCIDGLTAAAICLNASRHPNLVWNSKKLTGTICFYPGKYQEAPPYDLIAGKHVWLVDFSYKKAQLLEILQICDKLTILDHHVSAKDELENIEHPKLTCIFDLNRSGAGITWDYLFTGPRLEIIDLIEDRDLWLFKYGDKSKFINYRLGGLPYTVDAFYDYLETHNLQSELEKGATIHSFFMGHVKHLADKKFTANIGGYTVPVCNAPYFYASELGGLLAEGQPFAGVFSVNDKEEYWSLRSNKDGIDVSKIAITYGGGGHKHSAGFRVPVGTIIK
jgi:oligoribonuclease NrnB/cAMP/cGMP phosphodiesterase (DHH superfamily)